MVHLYTGDGKGKTTAAVGLAVRAVGFGGKVLFIQFLKSGESNEISILESLGVEVFTNYPFDEFLWNMDNSQLAQCRELQKQCIDKAQDAVASGEYDMIVLDECMGAIQSDMLSIEKLIDVIKVSDTEIVLTGRGMPSEILDKCDYVTEMVKRKHPFERGIQARAGIEF